VSIAASILSVWGGIGSERAPLLQVPIYIQGLLSGSIRLDHKGQTQVICKATGNRTMLAVSDQGTLSRLWKGNSHQVHLLSYSFLENVLLDCKRPPGHPQGTVEGKLPPGTAKSIPFWRDWFAAIWKC